MQEPQNSPVPEDNDATPPVSPAMETAAPLAADEADKTAAAALPDVPAEATAAADAVRPADGPADGLPTTPPAAAPAAPAIADLPPAAVAAKLAELFPPLFGAGRALPIKLRIQADIQQRAPGLFNKKSLSIFLHRHTTSTAYLKALAQAPARLDLDGQPAGDIAQEHRDAAAVELNRRLAIVQERRAAERKAQRQAERPAAPAAAAADGVPAAAAPGDRPPRPPRPPRPEGAPRGDRPPRPERPRGDGPGRPDRAPRPGRPDRPAGAGRMERPDRPPRQDRAAHAPRAGHHPSQNSSHNAPHNPAQTAHEPQAPREPPTPEQAAEFEARRSRALVLRAFETTTLTRANFCALKGMNDAALEAILVQARAERPALKAPPGRPISR